MSVSEAKVWEKLKSRNIELGPVTDIADGEYRHWKIARDAGDVAWLVLDRAGESANTLSEEVMEELGEILENLDKKRPKALVLRSAKPGGFAAGADIRDFKGVRDARQIEERMKDAHRILDRLAHASYPTLAIVHGHCLGGGLELALGCDHRIAIAGATFGLPEVLLGLHPGLGGTYRLPALIDPIEAMTMMLTGKTVHDRKARKLGLVEAVIEERHVDKAVSDFAAGGLKKQDRNTAGFASGWKERLLGLGPARGLAAKRMRGEVEKRARREHYPAPYALIELWEHANGDMERAQKAEIRSFAEQLSGETAQNLIRVFFLREKMKSKAKGESDIAHVHVIGAGTMGGDIATWCAARGLKVTLSDLQPKAIAAAVGRASKFYDKKLHSGIAQRDALDLLMPDFNGVGVSTADIVIEAVAEKVEIKKALYAELARKMKPGAILATNTSSIPLEDLRESAPSPERFVGVHFFNPVTQMELVEIVRHDRVSDETLVRAQAFCGDISRLPALVRSAPGFLVNRALFPYLAEAFLLIDEGVAKETIDRAAERFGMPMGPVELADRVGLDICLEVARMLRESDPENTLPAPPAWLERHVQSGETGRKAGRGLYSYDEKGKPKKQSSSGDDSEDLSALADRMVLPMLNTLVACLREGVVEDEETLDGAMIFGTGFAPFRGGPLHYARKRGVADIKAALSKLEDKHGQRFAPDEGWQRLEN
ncbi:3-hydroxyacyl-CoA dehydrogenase NAD-binding domain-containing protein [Nitratireductor basaltis]|uniref:enoyl-CoA hydratase n=1 Tax=Nitratireductor basaltis TaxID=472175 RepID=A0A084U9X4_9HYPH|nr:3-hydroxyacyl-CoA dehydrogenase NAD-binding domain-containing protein [Nitratireductor basaltis]KFB09760.1 3-hydroxyacyl-CoA dehydrogenase / short chain enoyl-CoA hydratase [Nitratireductor basaltis]